MKLSLILASSLPLLAPAGKGAIPQASTPAALWTLDTIQAESFAGTGPAAEPARILGDVRLVPGRIGMAAAFDDVAAGQVLVPAPTLPGGSTPFTLTFWVQNRGHRQLYGTCVNATGAKGFVIRFNPDNRLSLGAGGNWRALTSSSPLPTGIWTHVALSYDGMRFRLYVAGTEVGDFAPTTPPLLPDLLEIGSAMEKITLPDGIIDHALIKGLAGNIDHFEIHKRIIDPSEITALASSSP